MGLYQQAKKVLEPDFDVSIKELKMIRDVLSLTDELCNDLRLSEIECLWFQYSSDSFASCLIVSDYTIQEFKKWIEWTSC